MLRRAGLRCAGQGNIILTGIYSFFNLTTILLCLPLLDDECLPRWVAGDPTPSPNHQLPAFIMQRPRGCRAPCLEGLGFSRRFLRPVTPAHPLADNSPRPSYKD